MTLPTSLRAGDTWTINVDDAGHAPSAGWSAVAYFKAAAGSFSIAGTGSGSTFTFTRSAATSAATPAGEYALAVVATKGDEVATVASGPVQVLANLAAAGDLDTRTHAAKVVEAIEAVIEGRATRDQEEYTIGDRSLKRTPLSELLALRSRYRIEAQRERAQSQGVDGRRYFVRFR